MYAKFYKRLLDFWLALLSLIVLLPVLLILSIVGTFVMKGTPFFKQQRLGKDERIFKLIKFRSMNNTHNAMGQLLSDEKRLIPYGKWLRTTSLDELPSLVNILKGDLAIVGPRPLLVEYLPRYNEEQRHRHDVRPGLTGYAQVNGRNTITWEEKFKMDVWYTKHITLWGDIMIILKTMRTVIKRENISSNTSATMEKFMGTPRRVETTHE